MIKGGVEVRIRTSITCAERMHDFERDYILITYYVISLTALFCASRYGDSIRITPRNFAYEIKQFRLQDHVVSLTVLRYFAYEAT